MRKRPKVLLIAEAANPQWVSVPLVGWSLASALREVADVHLVTQIRNRNAILEAGLREGDEFTCLDSESVMIPISKLGNLLRGGSGKGWTTATALAAFGYYYFERLLWAKFGRSLQDREFDLVHRITPLSPTVPSLLAKKCSAINVPFVLGPLNGGVPWPKGFDTSRRQEKEWLSYVRNAYKLLPGYRSTLQHSSALIMGSRATFEQVPERHHAKCIYLPENAINPERFSRRALFRPDAPLRACFVGRLVPYKGVDMLLEAAAPLLREGRLQLDIIGDGPMMQSVRDMILRENIGQAVTLHGWVAHGEIQNLMCRSQVLAFPSIREFGGGVVLEAMALGMVPLIVDYAGPGELVTAKTGIKIPIGPRAAIVAGLQNTLGLLVSDPSRLAAMGDAAQKYVSEYFTWPAKAGQILEIYRWVLGQRIDRPHFFQIS